MTSSSILVCFLTDISNLGLEYDVLVHEDQTLTRKSRNTEQKKTKSKINKSGQKGKRNNSKQGGASQKKSKEKQTKKNKKSIKKTMRSKKHKKNFKKETTQDDKKKKIMLRQQSDQCVEVRFSR